MAFQRVCSLNDLWQGDMAKFAVDGREVLLVHTEGGQICALQTICPHQQVELAEGTLDGNVLICRQHLWEIDVTTGKGVNPDHAEVALYPVRVDGDDVYVEMEGIEPKFAHS